MWRYKDVSREEFEKRKDLAARYMREFGCVIADISHFETERTRTVYKFKNGFYRIDEVLFSEKPFIVLEYAETEDEVRKNIMEDLEPFPYDLSDEEIRKEVGYSIGIEPYPIT